MDHHSYAGNANTSFFISVFTALVSFANAAEAVKSVAGLVSIFTGVMAIRYYYHATKKINK